MATDQRVSSEYATFVKRGSPNVFMFIPKLALNRISSCLLVLAEAGGFRVISFQDRRLKFTNCGENLGLRRNACTEEAIGIEQPFQGIENLSTLAKLLLSMKPLFRYASWSNRRYESR